MNKYKTTVINFDNDKAAESFNEFLSGAWPDVANYLKQSLQGKEVESDPSIIFDTDKNEFTISIESKHKGHVLISKKKGYLESISYDDLIEGQHYTIFNRAKGLEIFTKMSPVDFFVGVAPTISILTEELHGLVIPSAEELALPSKEEFDEAVDMMDEDPTAKMEVVK